MTEENTGKGMAIKNEAVEYRTETITIGNAIVCIHRPILTDEERAKREKEVIQALQNFGRETMKN